MMKDNRQNVLPSTSYNHATLGVADIGNTKSFSLQVGKTKFNYCALKQLMIQADYANGGLCWRSHPLHLTVHLRQHFE
jgi:hypothetical protein